MAVGAGLGSPLTNLVTILTWIIHEQVGKM